MHISHKTINKPRKLKNIFKKKNNTFEDEITLIKTYEMNIFEIIDLKSLKTAKEKRNKLFKLKSDIPSIIRKIIWNLIIPQFKKITNHLKDKNIIRTNNKIENSFLKNFLNHIKKIFKTDKGILKRLDLRLDCWNTNKELLKIGEVFDSAVIIYLN